MANSNPERQEGPSPLASVLGCGALFLLLGFLNGFFRDNWQVIVSFLFSAAGWLLLKARKDRWSAMTSGFLGSIALGLGLLLLAAFIFAVMRVSAEPGGKVWIMEETLVRTREDLSDLLEIRNYLLALVVLLGVTLVYPRLKLVTAIAFARRILSGTLLVLIAATTFTFFGQYPVSRWAIDVQDRFVLRYRFSTAMELGEIAQQATAETFKRSLPRMTGEEKQKLRTFFEVIRSDKSAEGLAILMAQEISGKKANRIVREPVVRVNPADVAALPVPEEVAHVPEDRRERERLNILLEEKEQAVEQASNRAHEARLALQQGLAAVLGLPLSRFEPILGAYLEELVAIKAEEVFLPRAVQFHQRTEGRIPTSQELRADDSVERIEKSFKSTVAASSLLGTGIPVRRIKEVIENRVKVAIQRRATWVGNPVRPRTPPRTPKPRVAR
jgi:hypothetical protein